eukprot:15365020-Ditylum_brightwellii.AAC.2
MKELPPKGYDDVIGLKATEMGKTKDEVRFYIKHGNLQYGKNQQGIDILVEMSASIPGSTAFARPPPPSFVPPSVSSSSPLQIQKPAGLASFSPGNANAIGYQYQHQSPARLTLAGLPTAPATVAPVAQTQTQTNPATPQQLFPQGSYLSPHPAVAKYEAENRAQRAASTTKLRRLKSD